MFPNLPPGFCPREFYSNTPMKTENHASPCLASSPSPQSATFRPHPLPLNPARLRQTRRLTPKPSFNSARNTRTETVLSKISPRPPSTTAEPPRPEMRRPKNNLSHPLYMRRQGREAGLRAGVQMAGQGRRPGRRALAAGARLPVCQRRERRPERHEGSRKMQ